MKHKAHHKLKKVLDHMGKKHAEAMKHIAALEKHEKNEMKEVKKHHAKKAKHHKK